MLLFVLGGSKSATDRDVDFDVLVNLMTNTMGQQYMENPLQEVSNGVSTGITCR
jgi:hypothetical protein